MDKIVTDLRQIAEFVKKYVVNADKKYYQSNLEQFLIGDILNDKFADYPPQRKKR